MGRSLKVEGAHSTDQDLGSGGGFHLSHCPVAPGPLLQVTIKSRASRWFGYSGYAMEGTLLSVRSSVSQKPLQPGMVVL